MGEGDHALRGALGPLSGLIVKLLTQLVREILHLSGKDQGISETCGCGNHALGPNPG